MKTKSIILSILLLISLLTTTVYGQQCNDYPCVVKKVKNAIAEKKYQVAFENIESANSYPNKVESEIKSLWQQLFKALENDKQRAEKLAKDLTTINEKNKKLISYFGFAQERAWAYRDGKFAVIDNEGNQLTDFAFKDPQNFRSDGWALVKKDTSEFFMYKDCKTFSEPFDWVYKTNVNTYKVRKGKNYTFVDSVGKPLKGWRSFPELYTFSDGLAWFRENGKIGFIDNTGSVKITPQYDQALMFADGISRVNKSSRWGLIDVNGKEVLAPNYSSISYFSNSGLAVVSMGLKMGLINNKGVELLKTEFDGFGYYNKQGYVSCIKDKKSGLVNPLGKVIVPPQYDAMGQINDYGQVVVGNLTKDNLYAMSIIDTTGKEILESNPLRPISNIGSFDIAAIGYAGNLGYLNVKTNKVVANSQFDFADEFTKDGLAIVGKNGKAGFIDTTGKTVIPLQYDVLLRFGKLNLAGFRNNGKAGFINRKGEVVIQPKFTFVNNFGENGLAAVSINNKWGFINTKGDFVINPIFDNLMTPSEDPIVTKENKEFVNNQIFATIGTETFLINDKGEMIVK